MIRKAHRLRQMKKRAQPLRSARAGPHTLPLEPWVFFAMIEFRRPLLSAVCVLLGSPFVLAAEPEATRRLLGHVGRSIGVQWRQWPALLPAPPRAVWRVTPAGLLELDEDLLLVPVGVGEEETLVVTLDGSEMLRWGLAGMAGRPPMDIRGDAAFAAEVAWLAENLRWDIEDDLARVIGDGPARLLGRLGGGLAQTVGAFVQRVRRPA